MPPKSVPLPRSLSFYPKKTPRKKDPLNDSDEDETEVVQQVATFDVFYSEALTYQSIMEYRKAIDAYTKVLN